MRVLREQHLAERASREGRAATRALRASLDLVVVVGSGATGGFRMRPLPVVHVGGPDDLVDEWFLACRTVGVFRGSCCVPARLEAVARRLEAMGRAPRESARCPHPPKDGGRP